ncbi:MAG TPA: porphobilinogen synthase [Nitrososphaeraceae archaeon]|nr:porphobilinogen synthase [Nitrososphaeraceae archaeon]
MAESQIRGLAADHYSELLRRVGLRKKDLISPIFVYDPGSEYLAEKNSSWEFAKVHMNDLSRHIQSIVDSGINSVILFGVPRKRDEHGYTARQANGVVQKSTKKIKKEFEGLIKVITDVCVCQYNLSGHCGLLRKSRNGRGVTIDNDSTLAMLSKIATNYAESGADIIAPSSMMDGQVKCIRSALDVMGFRNTKIMAYSAKHASSLYSPFRMTAYYENIKDQKGIDKSSYQVGFANPRQVAREVQADIQEGADMVMIKPGLAYLDLISMVRDRSDFPVIVQNVSGEYAMIKAAAKRGWIDEEEWKVNCFASMKRAGANSIISYFSLDVAKYIEA